MKTKLGKVWEALHNSFWFVPSLMVIGAIAIAYFMLSLDHEDKEWLQGLPLTYSRGPEGAREVLSTVAGSMVSVATTAFSIVIVALQLASGQFGPRLLGNFMRDTGNQIVLGTFISTFVYCLLILRTVNSGDNDEFVPHISVTFSLVLAIFSIAVLIYFLHHVATSIQAQHVISQVGTELNDTIERLFPKKIGRSSAKDRQEIKDTDVPDDLDDEARPIKSEKSGYIQAIDDEELIEIAAKFDAIVRLNYRPGDFVVKGSDLASVWHGQQMNKQLVKKLKGIFIIGNQRTPGQDVEFSINQLVEIAVRALSTGVNDPFTAIRCIDQLSAALCHFVQKEIPSRYRYDENKKLRAIAEPTTFTSVVDAAFNQIRQAGQTDVAVTIRLLEAIARIAQYTTTKEQRAVLLRHAQMIERGSHEGISEELDKKDVQERYFAILKLLKAQ